MQKKTRSLLDSVGVLGALFALTGCSADADTDTDLGGVQQAAKVITVDVRRSLAVTEQTILVNFSLERVLTQLASQSGVPGLTALKLFQQWWDTQNPLPGSYAGAHCNDNVAPGGTVLNGYPYLCRDTAEGVQVSCNPFVANSPCAYIPIGLFNRFDQAPEDGAHCGEYRIVYAKQSGIASTSDRNLLIFEAALLNPHPQQGLKGCKQIVDTWVDLSKQNNITSRRSTLDSFYFSGQGVIDPVISISNFGDNPLGAGQIRTNQFSNTTTGWSLREFKLIRTCSGNSCTAMRFVPVTDKNNAFGNLFAPTSTLAQAGNFQAFLPSQVASLAAGTIAGIDIKVPDAYNSGQSQASGTTATEMRYGDHFPAGVSALRTSLQNTLTSLGSTLSPDDIVSRAQAQTCAGCHRLNNLVGAGGGLTWPASLGFTHVTERETELVGTDVAFKISDALKLHFLPARKGILEGYANDVPHPSKGADHPLNGSRSHG